MVTLKKRRSKGETYLYLSTSVSYGGERKVFERSLGSIRTDKAVLERRKKFQTEMLELKKQFHLTCMEARGTRFQHLPGGYSYFLALAKNQYHQGLSRMYPSDLEKYRKEQEVRYVHHTTALEGNTLSLRETAMVLDRKMTPGAKDLREVHEVENYSQLRRYTRSHRKDLDLKYILKMHHFIQRNIDDDSAGSFRRIPVGIVGSKWEPPHPVEIEEMMADLLTWYNENKGVMHPLELAGILHHRLLQIHPFKDGNGRVGREVMNFILVRNGFPPIVIPTDRRLEYYEAMEKADEGDPSPLLEMLALIIMDDYLLAVGGIVDDLRSVLGDLNEEEKMELIGIFHWNLRMCWDMFTDVPPRLRETIQRSGLIDSLAPHGGVGG